MRLISVLTLSFAALAMLNVSPAIACSTAGPTTHVGQVLEVDREAGSFSIMDAEKLTAITFSAEEAILNRVEGTDKTAVVDFRDMGSSLKAVKVSLH